MNQPRRHQAGGDPAQGPHPDTANPVPSPAAGNEFPDAPAEATDRERRPDQPDLDAFAAAIGTDRLADAARDDGGDGGGDRSGSGDAGGRDWRAPASKAVGGLATGAKRLAGKLGDVAERLVPSADDDADEGDHEPDLAALRTRVDGVRTAMVTTIDEQGTLSSRPLTLQEITDDGDIVFVVARDAAWVTPGMDAVNVALVDDGRTWVSVSGRAVVRDDRAEIDRRWNVAMDTFFPDGRDAAVVLHVQSDRWEYWNAPHRAVQVVEIARSMLTDGPPDLGDSGTIET